MKILMVSNDRAFLGEKTSTGDTVDRHRAYGQSIEKLSIIVLTKNSAFSTNALSANVFAYPTNSRSFLTFVRDALLIAKGLCSDDHYDLVVCQDPFFTGLIGYYLKKKYGAQLLLDFHGDFWQNRYWLKENPLRLSLLFLSYFIVRRADALRTVSSGIKKKIIHRGVNQIPIAVIPTPVNLERFKTPDPETVLSIKREFPDQKIILWTGRLGAEKNLPFLLTSFQKIASHYPRVVLLLIGDGQEKTKINKLIISLGLAQSVKMLGQISYERLLNYFHAADIFVLPSRHESFGKVLLEAGASGKPSVASATTGAKEIIVDGTTGFLFPVNKTKKFIEKILLLLNDTDLAHQMGANAYQHIWQKYDYETSIKNVVAYWQKIVTDKK
jgi:glycosyltransferase involved in cell wall biosynthesis